MRKHVLIMQFLLAAYALPGCDTVCQYHGIGKKTFIKVLQLHPLLHLLDPDANIDDVIAEIEIFMGMRYGIQKDTNMSEKK